MHILKLTLAATGGFALLSACTPSEAPAAKEEIVAKPTPATDTAEAEVETTLCAPFENEYTVEYDFGAVEITDAAKTYLANEFPKLVDLAAECGGGNINIVTLTFDEASQALGQQRSDALKTLLVSEYNVPELFITTEEEGIDVTASPDSLTDTQSVSGVKIEVKIP